jgi:diaminopimelate epimerase
MTFALSKLHGLGNDFLVHLTDDPSELSDAPVWSERAVRWCHRSRGVGADGLILGVHGTRDADLVMVLHNADGSRAEMSGNGIRCLAHAEALRRGEPKGHLSIATDAGRREVDFEPGADGNHGLLVASVEMGSARPGPAHDASPSAPWFGPEPSAEQKRAWALTTAREATVDVGNPHLVLLVDDPSAVDMAVVGPGRESWYSQGINVHVVAPTPGEPDAMDMAIWERGAGLTEACGTGAVAVAHLAHEWGLTGPRVTVHMKGGDVVVDTGDPLVLHGPSVFIAGVEVPE